MIEIKPLDKSYLEKTIRVYQETFSKEPWFEEDSDEQVKNLFENHYNNNYYVGYVLVDNEEVIGFSLGFKKPYLNGMEYYIDQFAIKYEFQNKGLGKIFIDEIFKDIQKQGMNAIILNTEKGYPAQQFYLKNGFKVLEDTIILVKE